MKLSSRRIQWNVLRSALMEAWPVWLLVTGLVSSWFLAYVLAFLTRAVLATQVRYAGVLLEVFGFVLVAIGIKQTRRHFNRPSLAAKLSQWFKLLASAFTNPQAQTVVAATGRFNLEAGGPVIKATGTVGKLTLERRIELVEQKVELFREEAQKRTLLLEARFDEAKKSFQVERGQRTVAIEALSRRVEDYAVGGLHLEIVGLVWLVVGTLGSNIAEEMSKLIGWLN